MTASGSVRNRGVTGTEQWGFVEDRTNNLKKNSYSNCACSGLWVRFYKDPQKNTIKDSKKDTR